MSACEYGLLLQVAIPTSSPALVDEQQVLPDSQKLASLVPAEVSVDDCEKVSVGSNLSESPEPAKKRSRKATAAEKAERGPLIAKPPELPANMYRDAMSNTSAYVTQGAVEPSLSDQRNLRKQLDEAARLEAEQKKQEAHDKKQKDAARAIEKAEKKLEIARAKAAKLVEKENSKGKAKRRLDKEFLKLADPHKGETPEAPPASPEQPKPKRKARAKAATITSPNIKLSPKAKAFAAGSSSKPSPKKDPRLNRAQAALQLLRDVKLPDLKLPTNDFSKK